MDLQVIEEMIERVGFANAPNELDTMLYRYLDESRRHSENAARAVFDYGIGAWLEGEALALASWQLIQLLSTELVRVEYAEGVAGAGFLRFNRARTGQVTESLRFQTWDLAVVQAIGKLGLDQLNPVKRVGGLDEFQELFSLMKGLETEERAAVLAVRALQSMPSNIGRVDLALAEGVEHFRRAAGQLSPASPADIDELGAQLDLMVLP